MDGISACWRDRVRVTTRPIEDLSVDLLVSPGPREGLWELQAERVVEAERARARKTISLCCARPPLGGADAACCAFDWYGVALDVAAANAAVSVAVPALTHPDGDAEVPSAAVAALREGLERRPGIACVWIACAGEATAARWRAAVFEEDPFHPLPGLAAEVMRRYGTASPVPAIPERAYHARAPGVFASGPSRVVYLFGVEEGEEYLELCDAREAPSRILHLRLDADGALVEFEGLVSLSADAEFVLAPGIGAGALRWCSADPPASPPAVTSRDCPSLCELAAGCALPAIEGGGAEGR